MEPDPALSPSSTADSVPVFLGAYQYRRGGDASRTGLVGYVAGHFSYLDLARAFGAPTPRGGKSRFEWTITFSGGLGATRACHKSPTRLSSSQKEATERASPTSPSSSAASSGIVATIYDYREYPNGPEEVTCWHIGGRTPLAARLVNAALAQKKPLLCGPSACQERLKASVIDLKRGLQREGSEALAEAHLATALQESLTDEEAASLASALSEDRSQGGE